jgi:transposase-like protein
MPACKKCQSANIVKNGTAREKQRFKCKDCKLNFVEGDQRISESIIVKRALSVILYSLGQASLGFMGKLFGVHKTTVLR